MIAITTEQARNRFVSLSANLQDVFFSLQTAEIIDQIATQNHISEDKSYAVASVAGWVLLGFMHPEDVSKELQEEIKIPSQTADEISRLLNTKIFSRFQDDLQNVYAPVPHKNDGVAPKMLEDLVAPEIISQTAREAPRIGAVLIAGNEAKAAPAPAAPKKLPDVGWSRSTPETPVVQLKETFRAAPQAPTPGVTGSKPASGGAAGGASGGVPAGPKPAMPAGPMGEFERMNFTQQKVPTPGMPTAPAPAASAMPAAPAGGAPSTHEPAPVMLHEDASYKTEPKTPDFHIQLPGVKLDAEKTGTPSRPAMMELNKNASPATPSSAASTPTKVVHYTEYKPTASGMSPAPKASMPVSPISIAPQGPREITELTGNPGVPKPPSPPAAGPDQKVVFKNYAESSQPPAPPAPPPSLPPKP